MNESLLSQPIRLTEEEKQDPYSVLQDFFGCFSLQDMHELLWDWQKHRKPQQTHGIKKYLFT